MPTPPTLDVERLLAPLPGADPAGQSPTASRNELKQLRQEAVDAGRAETDDGPVDLPWDDPGRLNAWRQVVRFTQTVLEERTKSLEAGTRAADALARLHGVAGLRDGFTLLRRMTEECWGRMYPKIDLSEADEIARDDFGDDDDGEQEYQYERKLKLKSLMEASLEAVGGQYLWLDYPKEGALLPGTIRDIPLVSRGGRTLSVHALNPPSGTPTLTVAELPALARAAGPEAIQTLQEDVAGALEELAALQTSIETQFGNARATDDDSGYADRAPYFRHLQEALEQCKELADDLAAAGGAPADDPAAPDAATGGYAVGAVAAPALDRAGLYRQLAEIAGRLEQFEPHSPVPLLLKRVAEMERLPFPELVRQLTREEKVLGFLERGLLESGGGSEAY